VLNGSYTAVYTSWKVNNVDRFKDIICYISSENASHDPTPKQKMFRGQTEATFRPGTVPIPVPVLEESWDGQIAA